MLYNHYITVLRLSLTFLFAVLHERMFHSMLFNYVIEPKYDIPMVYRNIGCHIMNG